MRGNHQKRVINEILKKKGRLVGKFPNSHHTIQLLRMESNGIVRLVVVTTDGRVIPNGKIIIPPQAQPVNTRHKRSKRRCGLPKTPCRRRPYDPYNNKRTIRPFKKIMK